MKKDSEFNWSRACKSAFDSLVGELISDRFLTHYRQDLPLRLACDASAFGLGAVLSHVFPNGEVKPIAYASRTLSCAERNYSQIDKEALAIVYACLLYTSPSPRDKRQSRMPSSA